MYFLYVLATSLCVVSATKKDTFYPSFEASIGNSDTTTLDDIQYRKIAMSTDSGWKAQADSESDGSSLSKAGHLKFGYRFTDDDESAIVWEYDTSVSTSSTTATWDAVDTTVDKPDIGLEFYYVATFPETSSKMKKNKREKKRQTSDIWDDGSYTAVAWQDVEVQVTSDCDSDQSFTITVTDASGTLVGSTTGVNSADFTIPSDSIYPVTIEAVGDVGTLTSTLSNDQLPIKFAIGDGDNVPTQTYQYLFEIDFCPDNYDD